MPEYYGELTHVEVAKIPLWLIALLPFLGAATNAVFGRRLQASGWRADLQKRLHIGSPAVSAVAVGAMLGAFAIALVNVIQLVGLPAEQRYLQTHAWQMVRIGSLDVNFSFAMDPLSALMTLIITGVGTLIHVYATAYMEKEPAFWRFFTYLNLFIFSMLLLVLGDNFVVMFFGWEGVGLCSYLLIGFWYKDYKKATAGMKAFIVNRVGDWGFICGMALLFWGLGGVWLEQHGGEYLPDYRARFVAARKDGLAQHGGHGAPHGDHAAPHGDHAVPAGDHAAPAGDHAVPQGDHGEEHGSGHSEPHGALDAGADLRLAALDPAATLAANDGHDHGPGDAHGHDHGPGAQPRHGSKGASRLAGGGPGTLPGSGATSLLTMTTHPGARVYFNVASAEQLEKLNLPSCSSKESWNAASGPQLRADCYATAPFLRKRIASGIATMTVVPGNGASVTGDGDEYAAIRAEVAPNTETVITALGPTLTFRELHDQLVLKDASGKQFLMEALRSKTVWGGVALITLACLCFFVGATGKSAQIPLYVWLPDAMAGPTPVSALIHAATMVTAGVYMIARMNFLFSLAPTASGIVALVGALTALFAATIGFYQYDIKKVLAYSTVSQLGFMFIGVGVGAYWAGVFHLMTHAFFKACLFLGSGSVIHGMHAVVHDEVGSQDMRNMGGLRAVMPKTARTYKIACMAITAVPPGLAGFWSKDEILWKAWNAQSISFVPGWLVYAIGLLAALGTSFYMWRSYYLTFEGKHAKREIKDQVHESPAAMVVVLQILAGLAVVSGVLFGISSHFTGGIGAGVLPHEPLLEAWLHPVTAHHSAHIGDAGYGMMYGLMALSVLGALGSWGFAVLRYGASRPSDWAAREQTAPGFALFQNKYYVDEIYQATIVAAFMRLRLVLAEMDRWIVDGAVNGVGVVTRGVSWLMGTFDKHVVDGAVNFVADGTLEAGQKLRTMQTGRVQNYVYGILGGVAFLAVVQFLLR